MNYAISHLIPPHINEVKKRRLKNIEKTTKAVKDRLTAEIQYWDFQAADLKEKEGLGKINAKLNSQLATRKAEDFEARLKKRMNELETEKQITTLPPVIVGGSVIIPMGLLSKLTQNQNTFTTDQKSRSEIESIAMNTVIDIERSFGYEPLDVSKEKVGYDIESRIPIINNETTSSTLRFIEVKGRTSDAKTITVTKNEILTALNKPEEYILAIVEIDGKNTKTTYLKKPFKEKPDFSATSVNFNMTELFQNSKIDLIREGGINE